MLVSAYLVERGLILETHQVDHKSSEIKALPELIKSLALEGVVFAFDAINTETRYYISDLEESAGDFARRIRGYWGVENKVHYCKDVTLGEDKSRN